MISASTAGGLIVNILMILVSLVMLRKSGLEKNENHLKQVPGLLLRFSYEDLELATGNFKEILGCGGFGCVFKGVLEDGTIIAVKRLDRLSQGMRDFLAEVETIGSLHHFNLVRLMSNGSLDKWIFNRGGEARSLDWRTRKSIILDIAKGLAYLHGDCR
ncbi:Tyrosine-protein kinase [Parasponia andersonii]|uniref:Tyrosine-protein kinase n=1 Tax=Parasponia andersonii TaxID=3476 RepID=A0A2P5ARR8_PARAD|nr:Tyrosine-protein kinase [Parasponia andersonii]